MINFAKSLKILPTRFEGYCEPCRYLLPVVALVLLFLSSCAPVPREFPRESVSKTFADDLMKTWVETSSRITSVQGLAKAKVQTSEKSLNGTQVVLAEKPNRLRVETLGLFGSPLLLLAADGENIAVLLPTQNVFYAGSATPENLGRFVRIPARLSDLVTFLLYQPPIIKALSDEAFKLPDGGWLLILYGQERRQELTFNDVRQLVEVSYYDHGELFLRLNYGDFGDDGEAFPKSFTLELPGSQMSAQLEFSDLKTNGSLRTDVFQLTPPVGATVISLDD